MTAPSPAPVDRGERPRLRDLLAPLDEATFYARHWAPGVPFLSEAAPDLVAKIRANGELADVDALLAHYTRDVGLFGPGAARRRGPASAVREALAAGCNVYFPRVSEVVPAVARFFEGIAFELGFPPWQVNVEAFAGAAGGVSSRHYDHELNFQILLRGEKEWRLEPNRHIENPIQLFHPIKDESGEWTGFSEEGYADDPHLPTDFDPSRSYCRVATAGTVLFVPRGLWHETRSLTDTWGVNLAIKGVTRAEWLARALAARLLEDPRFRAPCDGYRGRTLGPAHARDRAAAFQALGAEASRALRDLSLLDVDRASAVGRR